MNTNALFARLRVLVVDDAQLMQDLLKASLQEAGCRRIVTIGDARKAYGLLQKKPFDLVLCDWNMPGISGLELLQRIRKDPDLAELPFIMITAEHDKELVKAALNEGVNGYIVKPFKPDMVLRQIRKVFARSQTIELSAAQGQH